MFAGKAWWSILEFRSILEGKKRHDVVEVHVNYPIRPIFSVWPSLVLFPSSNWPFIVRRKLLIIFYL